MASVNKVIIVGSLGRDPEIRYAASGDAIANIAVATNFRKKDSNTGEQKDFVEWHRISFFGRLAEIAGQYLKKGRSVYIEGRLQTRKYTDKDGVEKYATDIIAENMQMLNSASGGTGPGFNDQATPMQENTGRAQPVQQRQQGQQRPPQQNSREQNRDRQYSQGSRNQSGNDFNDDFPPYQ